MKDWQRRAQDVLNREALLTPREWDFLVRLRDQQEPPRHNEWGYLSALENRVPSRTPAERDEYEMTEEETT